MIEASGVTTARHDDDPETEGAQSTPNMIAVAVSIRTVTLTMAGLVKPISGVGTRSHTRTSPGTGTGTGTGIAKAAVVSPRKQDCVTCNTFPQALAGYAPSV